MRFSGRSIRSRKHATLLGAAVALTFATTSLHAGTETQAPVSSEEANAAAMPESPEPPTTADPQRFSGREAIRAIIEKETATTRLPPDIAEAVVFVESRYDSSVVGRVGEIGLMQVRPETAAMLGFRGTTAELAKPEINIHYGVIYLSRAWRLAQGDLCRALMKYRAGHGEETMTPRSVIYCNRARNRLVAMNSPFAAPGAVAAIPPIPEPAAVAPTVNLSQSKPSQAAAIRPTEVYARYKQGTAAASRAFWTAHEARVRAINARIESKWRRVASR
jgi:soluble lytic murein transglycosylase-like protein